MDGVGAHEVIIESPEHFQTLADMPEKRVEDLFWAYRDRVLDLRRDTRLRYLLLCKNHGEAAGAVLEHTHSQLIALPVVPKRVQEEIDGARKYFDYKERCVYCDIVAQEAESAVRIIHESEHFMVIAPYASRSPFETWIIPKVHNSHAENMAHAEIHDLAPVLRTLLRRMNSTLENPPYNMILHSAPMQDQPMPHYHWHLEIIPRMTNVAGFEWGTGLHINPTPPEEAAKFLREATT
jgi:UDPglucose--hexose-1-phosphate uridylyltransferase